MSNAANHKTALSTSALSFGLLTEPHVLNVDDKASSQVEDGEQGVAHEGRDLQCGQGSGHKQSHGSAAVHHQPHQEEVEEETIGGLVQTGQPINGQTVDQGEHAVLRQLSQDLRTHKEHLTFTPSLVAQLGGARLTPAGD